jgi:hypothetical protein
MSAAPLDESKSQAIPARNGISAWMSKWVFGFSSWPMIQTEKPNTIPFGPGPDNGVRHWCQPLITMHGVGPDDVNRIWQFEQQREDHTVNSAYGPCGLMDR